MAMDKSAIKTEHNGAKNMSHDKICAREDMKAYAKKYRRRADKMICREASQPVNCRACGPEIGD